MGEMTAKVRGRRRALGLPARWGRAPCRPGGHAGRGAMTELATATRKPDLCVALEVQEEALLCGERRPAGDRLALPGAGCCPRPLATCRSDCAS